MGNRRAVRALMARIEPAAVFVLIDLQRVAELAKLRLALDFLATR